MTFRRIFISFGIALAYVLAAQLGYLVSLPGYTVTLFWPASGVALAAVLIFGRKAVPGIAVGTLVTNLWAHQADPLVAMLVIGVMTSVASTLAALIAGGALRRMAPDAPGFVTAGKIFKGSIIMAGGCALAATGGVGSLYLFDQVPDAMLGITWTMWWVGDYCGMIAYGPVIWLVTLFFRLPQGAWKDNPIFAAAVLNSLVAILALVTFSSMWRSEIADMSKHLTREAAVVAGNLSNVLHSTQHDMSSIGAFMYASEDVTATGFQRYVDAHVVSRHHNPPAQAVGWAPRVTDPLAWNASMENDVSSGVQLYEMGPFGQHVPVTPRQEYFPVQYIQPLEGNQSAIGFDLVSEARRRKGLEAARDSGQIAMVAPIFLVQSPNRGHAMLVCLPVYRPGAVLDSIDARRANLVGFASGVYLLSVLFESAVPEYGTDIDLRLIDESQPTSPQVYYTKVSSHRASKELAELTPKDTGLAEIPQGSTRISFAGHSWLVLATPGPDFIQSQRTWLPWIVLMSLLAFGLGATCFLVERLSVLHAVTIERRKTEQALLKAQAANKSKEYFMVAAAHDIKQPLYALGIIVESLLMTDLPKPTASVVRSLRQSIKQMSQHFDALMDIGRFHGDSFDVNPTHFRLSQLADRIDQEISSLCAEKGLGWRLDMDDVLVYTDEELLLRLFRNLLVNAVANTASGEVCCFGKREGDVVKFLVSDTGTGMNEREQKVVIDQFSQPNKDNFVSTGMGLGLSIVANINRALGLGLQLSSVPLEGTQFRFRLPISADQEQSG